MTIEDIVDRMIKHHREIPVAWHGGKPCSDAEIVGADKIFADNFHHPFPDAYKRILRRSNGVISGNLIIWPIKPEPECQETILSENIYLRERISNEFIYFSETTLNANYYGFNSKKKEYCAIYSCGTVCETFSDADEMYLWMLEGANI